MKQFLLLTVFSFQILWSQIDYKLIKKYEEHSSGIECVVLSPDGKTLMTADEGGFIFYWDVNTMTITYRTRGHGSMINSLLFNKSGTKFVTCDESGKVKLWDFATKKLLGTFTAPMNLLAFAVLSDDEKYIYFGGYPTGGYDYINGDVYSLNGLYKVNVNGKSDPELVAKDYFNQHSSEAGSGITDGNIDVTGKYIMFTKGYRTYFWNIDQKKMDYSISTSYSLNNLTPTEDYIYVWGGGYMMKLDCKKSYQLGQTIPAYVERSTYSYSKMAISSDKKWVVTGEDANNVNIWNTANLKIQQTLKGHTAHVRTFTFAKNDSIIISGGYDGSLTVWGVPVEEKDSIIPVVDSIPVITEVVFTENNVPVSIKERDVELQSTITVNQPEFDIEVWDQSMVDGDSISLNLNGNWILQEYVVVKTKLKIHVKIDPNFSNNYLILYAHNLGEFSPNTAAVQVLIGDKKYKLQLSSDLSKSGALNFSYSPN